MTNISNTTPISNLKKLNRLARRADILATSQWHLMKEYGGTTGTKRTILIRNKKFIIKPDQPGEQSRRRGLIDAIEKSGRKKLEGKTFVLRVSKRYARSTGMNRIEPYYDLPTVNSILKQNNKPAVEKLIEKTGLPAEKVSAEVKNAYAELFSEIKKLNDGRGTYLVTHSYDVLVDYEKGKWVFRIVDF